MAPKKRLALTTSTGKSPINPYNPPNQDFSTRDIHEILQQYSLTGVVEAEAALLLSTVLEYLTAEIMEGTANAARTRIGLERDEMVIVKVEDMQTAIANNPELKDLVDKVRKVSQ